jgi:hypothetical protein
MLFSIPHMAEAEGKLLPPEVRRHWPTTSLSCGYVTCAV